MDQTVGVPAVDVPRFFDRIAHLYDTGWLQRALYSALQDRALVELRARQPGAVLDVGCGTGIFADRLQRDLASGAVAGCDMSAGMLAEAAARSRRVTWVRGDAARLPFRRGAFDAVVCTMAFHFFEQPRAWAEFRRVLAPGGHAVVGMVHPRTTVGSDRYSRWASAASKTTMTFPTAPAMRSVATAAGFEVIDQPQVDWRFHGIIPLLLTVARA